jgi:hypothetical protein
MNMGTLSVELRETFYMITIYMHSFPPPHSQSSSLCIYTLLIIVNIFYGKKNWNNTINFRQDQIKFRASTKLCKIQPLRYTQQRRLQYSVLAVSYVSVTFTQTATVTKPSNLEGKNGVTRSTPPPPVRPKVLNIYECAVLWRKNQRWDGRETYHPWNHTHVRTFGREQCMAEVTWKVWTQTRG